ncbi:hypothetical protein JEQ12_001773 [Ovis aries]|uniref:Uncharacterized protein n=1 Tax=Ovis aries TaxID=9940 RepID=A0A836AI05_SHEEP|nr:hypothetical protein JEQ12_001773 [Ovis aries]
MEDPGPALIFHRDATWRGKGKATDQGSEVPRLRVPECPPPLPSLQPCSLQPTRGSWSLLKLELATGRLMRDKGARQRRSTDRIRAFSHPGTAPEILVPQVALTQFERKGQLKGVHILPSDTNSSVGMRSVHRHIYTRESRICVHVHAHVCASEPRETDTSTHV